MMECVDQIAHSFIRADVCDGRICLIPDQLVLGTCQSAERVVDASGRDAAIRQDAEDIDRLSALCRVDGNAFEQHIRLG